MSGASSGEGWAATNIDDLGDGPGFRKIRPAIGVTAFGINAIVLPARTETWRHFTTASRRSTSSTADGSRWSSATARGSR